MWLRKLYTQSNQHWNISMREICRGAFARVEDVHLRQFEDILGSANVITDPQDVESYNIDWFKTARVHTGILGRSQVVLKPRTTQEVSDVLKICNQYKIAVCPQGGNTSVLGGSVPVFDEVILSTSLMNQVIEVNDIPGSVRCQAGCVLERLEDAVGKRGLTMPLDLGAKGSCQIGGNVSTNAGGLRLLRYGSLHANTLGLVAVTANGEVLDCMNTLKKDNTGYHLKHLFIGSEGTLGLVTEVAIQCPAKPASNILAFLGMNTFDEALQSFKLASKLLSEVLSSCEVIDAASLEQVTKKLGLCSPLDDHAFYLLLEVAGSNASHDEEKLNSFLEIAMNQHCVNDGLVTAEPSKIKALWELRERMAEALFTDGYAFMYDLSLPHHSYYEIVSELRKRLYGTEAVAVTGFGHLGDGNLHLNICSGEFSATLLSQIEPFVFEWVGERGGSVSAEHGIGFKKTQFLKYSKNAAAIDAMRRLKSLMDPQGILNPYKVLPPD